MGNERADEREAGRITAFWSRNSERFDALYEARRLIDVWAHRSLELRHDAAIECVRRHHHPSVLDIGCGTGRQLIAAIEAGASRARGIDLAPTMIEAARVRVDAAGYAAQVELRVANGVDEELRERFDIVWALGVFDYLRDPLPLLRSMMRSSRGEVLATFRRVWAVRSPLRWLRYRAVGCPIYLYTRAEIEAAAANAGLVDVRIHHPNGTFYLLEARSPAPKPLS